jgi:hypothetical protein
MVGIGAVLCLLVAPPAALAQSRIHTESKTKETGPGPDTKIKSESVVGTVKEYVAGRKIKVSGPNDKVYSFDLDEAVRVDGTVAIGQMAKVVWTKEGGRERVTVIAPFAVGIRSSTVKRMPAAGPDMHLKAETTTHKAGPDVKTKTEVVVGTVKEYEAGKKIKVIGPNDKDFSFDLDQNAKIDGVVAVGQRVRVEYTKGNRGKHIMVLTLPGEKKRR